MGICCYSAFCPCFATCQALDDVGETTSGYVVFASYLFGVGICGNIMASDVIAKKRGIKLGICSNICLNAFCCLQCSTIKEARLFKVGSSPAEAKMER